MFTILSLNVSIATVKAKQSTDFEQYQRVAHCFVFCRIVIRTISSCNHCAYASLVVGSTVTCSTAALQPAHMIYHRPPQLPVCCSHEADCSSHCTRW